MLLTHSIFVVSFFFSFFFTLHTVYVFWTRYKIDVISSNPHRSVVRMMQVLDLDFFFYFENVVGSFQARK